MKQENAGLAVSEMQRYVSSELSHFVGASLGSDDKRYSLLRDILKSGTLKSLQPPRIMITNPGKLISSNKAFTPQAVSFSDIPIGDLSIHIGKYKRFGLSFLKSFLISKGASPVFYVAKNSLIPAPAYLSGKTYQQSMVFDDMMKTFYDLFSYLTQTSSPFNADRQSQANTFSSFLEHRVFFFMKFFDPLKSDDDLENFYMEREWRVLGDVKFELDNVHRIMLPKSYSKCLRQDVPDYIGQITFVD